MTSPLRYSQERFSVILRAKDDEKPMFGVFFLIWLSMEWGMRSREFQSFFSRHARPSVRSPCYARVRHCGERVTGVAVIESIRTDFAGMHVILLSVKHTPLHQHRVAIKTATKIFSFLVHPQFVYSWPAFFVILYIAASTTAAAQRPPAFMYF